MFTRWTDTGLTHARPENITPPPTMVGEAINSIVLPQAKFLGGLASQMLDRLFVKCMIIFVMKSYVKVQKRLQSRQNIETKRHDTCFSKNHIPVPYGPLIELGIWAE